MIESRDDMKKYRCKICGYIYDDAKESVKFEDLPEDWTCPWCGAPKSMFELVEEENEKAKEEGRKEQEELPQEDLRDLSLYEKSLICSNLAKACEKEYKEEEQALLEELAEYYKNEAAKINEPFSAVITSLKEDISLLENAMTVANTHQDRGAKRVLTWATKSTNLLNALLKTIEEKGLDYIKNTKIWVCDICGYIYIGEVPPESCPICKVPSFKILEVA